MNDYDEMRKCTECGRMFDPVRYNQLTCSPQCAKLRNCRRVKNNYAAYGKNTEPRRCTICGEFIDYSKENKRRYARMHEDCVIKDLLDTVRKGNRLTDLQYNRMKARCLNTKDLILMLAREKQREKVCDMQ